MMLKMRVLAGYVWRICLLIACLISFSPGSAQEENAHFLWGTSDEEGFIAHLSLDSGLTIENAELVTSSETIRLRPRLLTSEQWIILDASQAVINTAPAIQAAVIDFIGRPEQEIGLIRFASAVETLSPTAVDSEIADWLGDYRAMSSENACLGDALQWLNEQPRQRDNARQVLAIVGEYQACDYPATDYPVEILVLGADAAPYGENASQASLQSLRPSLNQVKSRWAEPLFALEGSSPSAAEGTLSLSLSNGATISLPISYQIVVQPTLAPSEAASAAPTEAVAEASSIPASETSVPENQATEAVSVATTAPLPTATIVAVSSAPLPVSNDGLIISGGIAAAFVVVIVMALLLSTTRKKPVAEVKEEIVLDKTMPAPFKPDAQLDQTNLVTMREMLSKVGPTLVAQLIDEAGTLYEIHRPVTMLGRREDADIRIQNDKQISREHLRFSVRDDGSIWLTRLSQNPVLLNDMAVETTMPIKSGDILQLSPNLRLKLEMVSNE